ncbi:Uncharacterised protein [Bergeyella zoohelcum]|uniref:Uncharacterized protein n=1 Tax=Bergeyella zoohelcum TaxID=1015 RepID=A0A376BZZ0_9FLAO|nr:Uncharacterised protein [Bergeyella zoohelcum]
MIPTVDNKFEKFDIDDFNKNSIRGSLLISRKISQY